MYPRDERGGRRGACALRAARALPAVGRRPAAPRPGQARRRARRHAARAAARARRPDAPVGARAARRDPHRRRSPTTSSPRSTAAPTRSWSPPSRRGLRPARRRGAGLRHAGRRLRGAGAARGARRARDVRAGGDMHALIEAARAPERPAPAPPRWTWQDAARATWQVYERARPGGRPRTSAPPPRAGPCGGRPDRALDRLPVGAAAREHGRDRLQQDRQVERQRPVLEVEEVEVHEVVEVELRAPGDLPQAGDPREHQVALAVPVLEHRRSRAAGSGRGPTSDISPRSTLTSCGSSSSEKRRSRRPTGVRRGSSRILNSAPGGLVELFEVGLALLGVGVHRAELQARERPLADAAAHRAEQDRPARGQRARRS